MRTKRITALFLASALLLSLTGSAFADDKREEKPRFKGVELYSWKGDENKWVFVMLDGTNRLKSTDEVKKSKNQIKGVASLKTAFGKLAKNEQVFWNHMVEGFEFPPKAIKEEIATAAKTAEIKISIGGLDE